MLAKCIETFGFNAPILVDRHGKIIAGHDNLALRLKELSQLGLEFDFEAIGFEMPEVERDI